jgi:nucleoside-diphosphate kinase
MKKTAFIFIAGILILVTLLCFKTFFSEKSFAIIKPDAVKAKNSGKIIDIIEQHGFEIPNLKKVVLNKNDAEKFYAIHKDRPFFNDLVAYMSSGPIIVMVLQKHNAVQEWRNLMGATDPAKASEGTIRKLFGTDITHNATHGSDSPENAIIEIRQFFQDVT